MANCPQCGAELPAETPAGLCPQCLLQQGLGSHCGAAPTDAASGSRFVPPLPSELNARLPNLEVLELLGQGGMGAVYKARQPGLDRLVAVKVLPPGAAGDPHFAERFGREARALARLSHPHIVAVYDFGQVDGLYYLVMEYVDGVNVRQLMRAGRVSPPEALALVPQICDALQFAHDEGIVHRDIKPENILVDGRGRVKIADFGLARMLDAQVDHTLTGAHQVMGTPRYMAPEQMEGSHAVDHRADIYSLGVVFYELLTGELPWGRFAPPSKKVQVDVRLDEVVLRALAKEPELRYQSAAELKHDTESAASGVFSNAPPSMPPSRSGMVIQPLVPAWSMQFTTALFVVVSVILSTFGLAQIIAVLFLDWNIPGVLGAFLGSGFGCFCGGLGSLAGCLNTYRKFDHTVEWRKASHWTLLDRCAVGGGAFGLLLVAFPWILAAKGVCSPASGPVTAALFHVTWVTGIVTCGQAILFGIYRVVAIGMRPRGATLGLVALGMFVVGSFMVQGSSHMARPTPSENFRVWILATGGTILCIAALAAGLLYLLPRPAPPESRRPASGYRSEETAMYALGWIAGTLWRQPWFRNVLKWCALLVYLACLSMFFSFHFSGTEASFQIQIGQPTPWIEWQRTTGSMRRHVNLVSWSVGAALLGVAALALERQIERVSTGKVHSIWWHYGLWALLLVMVLGVAIMETTPFHATPVRQDAELQSSSIPVNPRPGRPGSS